MPNVVIDIVMEFTAGQRTADTDGYTGCVPITDGDAGATVEGGRGRMSVETGQ